MSKGRRKRKQSPPRKKINLSRSFSKWKSSQEDNHNLKQSVQRSPITGSLMNLGRSRAFSRIHAVRDSILSIKRYIRSRIEKGVFAPLSKGVNPSKMDLRRIIVWLQPSRASNPTNTERWLFNSHHRILKNGRQLGTGAFLIPGACKRTCYDFFTTGFSRLKNRVLFQKRIPESLLGILHWL